MIISIRNSCTDPSSYRAARIKSMFNVEERGNGFSLDADLPADDPSWRIGVIVGPSGSGKSSLGRCFGLTHQLPISLPIGPPIDL